MNHKPLHRKLKIEQHEPQQNRGELRCSEGRTIPAPHVAPVVLLLLITAWLYKVQIIYLPVSRNVCSIL
jgi:hypothetical protein